MIMSIFEFIHHEKIDSTNAEAIRKLKAGEVKQPCVIYADVQESGKGRTGRQWLSPEGNLYSSFLIPAEQSPNVLPFAISLAVYDVLCHFMESEDHDRIGLKWPNDVLIDGSKCCGILIEKETDPDDQDWYIIGIGLNLVFAPQDIDGKDAYGGATCLSYYTTYRPSRKLVLEELAKALEIWTQEKKNDVVLDAWRKRCYGQNSMIIVRLANGETEPGTFAGIDDQGYLLLQKTGGETKKIASADVFFPSKAS